MPCHCKLVPSTSKTVSQHVSVIKNFLQNKIYFRMEFMNQSNIM